MSNEKETNYYLKKKKILMRTFDAALLIVKPILINRFGVNEFNEINNLMKSGIEVIIMNFNRPEDLIKVMSGKDVKCTRLIPSSKS